MQYIIDGYNLLYKTDFETREQLIEAIAKFCKLNNKTAKIVFDGDGEEEFVSTRVEVIYAGDADIAIVRLLAEAQTPSFYTLVSSDNDLIAEAKCRKIAVVKSEDFDYTIQPQKQEGDKEVCYLSDDEVEKQLKEFNYFKS